MVKLIEKAGEVSRVIEFDTVAELVEYERSQNVEVDYSNLYGERSIKLAESSPFTSTWTVREKAKGAATNNKANSLPTGYVPFVKVKTLEAHIYSQKISGETVVASRDDGLKYLIEVDANQLIWSNK
ncbi:hypothetical protein VP137E351_P0059 [Vibrio phage 137E35-1]|nr:hypothetical protein VP137E351_P0059 [Vibrio phage 137E35-1]CAH9016543.1 hypothetical protein VP230E391_P0059 [Vibrio phage 230E39-1]